MNRFVAKFVALVVAAAGFAGSAVAGPVSISTGVAGWKFVNFVAGAGAATGTLRTNTENAAAADANAVSIAKNPAWVAPTNAAFSPEAGFSWISALSNGASNGLFGYYTYELTMAPPAVTAGASYLVSGKVASDNVLTSFTINGSEKLTSYVTGATSFSSVATLPSGSAVAPLVLRVTVLNISSTALAGPFGATPTDSGTAPGSTTNPTGLLLQGSAVSVVPLPSAAWAGLALLGTCGVMQYRRKMALQA